MVLTSELFPNLGLSFPALISVSKTPFIGIKWGI